MKKRVPARTDAWKDDLLDRPLGLDRKVDGGALRLPTAGEAGSAMLALLVLAGSVWTALQPSGFRVPPPVAVSTPQEVAVAPQSQPQPMPTVTRGPSSGSDGPSIHRVEPPAPGADGNVVIIRDPSAIGQDLRVAHIPDADLIQEADEGLLPVRAADGRRPFDVYARPWSGARGARIAIVIGGVGISQTSSQRAVETLPPEITLGFAPSGNSLDRWMQAARRKGHELVLQVPMEPFDYPNVDPGRNTLRVEAQGGELLRDLRLSLARITNYVGVMNYMGGRFVASSDAMGALMGELGERGLMYLDDGSSARTLAPTLAAPNRVPLAGVDATIDQARDRASILARLDELERTARARGYAIGAGTAFDVTVDTVTSWATEARRRGIEIVPVSALASDPGR